MKPFLQILTILFLTNTAFAQKDTSRYYKLSDDNVWVGKTYILPEPNWNSTGWNFNDYRMNCFDSIILFLNKNPKLVVEIGYHTDNRPIPMTLDSLSDRRAMLIKKYFIDNGINEERIFSHGYADHVPRIIENDTNITFTNKAWVKCYNKSFLIKKNTILDANFIKSIQDSCFREMIHILNRRPEMKIIKIE